MEFLFLSLFSDEIFRYFLLVCNGLALLIWMFTLVTQNFSQMDRLWPILPVLYSWGFLYTALTFNPSVNKNITFKTQINESNTYSQYRLYLITLFITMWGLRLFYYFWRRGYYKWEHEDYRWEHVKRKFDYPNTKAAFHVFNFVFMGFIQNWILLGYTLPLWFIQTNFKSQEPFNVYDIVVAILYLIFFSIEAIADEQQWNFQSKKHAWLKEQKDGEKKNANKYTDEEIEDFKRGFLVKGLFAYCRHPNYFGDMFLWWAVYFFSISSQANSLKNNFQPTNLFNYSMISALFMTYMFKRSVRVTEKIAFTKYGLNYAHYKSMVGRIIPRSLTAYRPLEKKSD